MIKVCGQGGAAEEGGGSDKCDAQSVTYIQHRT